MHIFIINPKAGNKKSLEVVKYLNTLNVKNNEIEMFFTHYKEHATSIAYNTSRKYPNSTIYSVGGDGTLNEIVNGIAGSNAKLGIIPLGTGNDFYKVSNSINGKIDLGKVNDKYFINISSIGLDANVADIANELKKSKCPNKLAYLTGLLKGYNSYKNIESYIDNEFKKITILAICNGTYYGGGFKIAPTAIINDGLFDIYSINDLNKLQIISLLLKLINGNHTNDNRVNYYRSDRVKVDSNVNLICNVDGEIIKGSCFDFKLEKNAIELDNSDKLNVIKTLKLTK